jgi:hypothetical protein
MTLLRSVVFPIPFFPRMAKISPGPTAKLTPRRTGDSP